MEKGLENFRFDRGKHTYHMAWVVEFCLFGLGIALAVFNIIFGLTDEEVDIVSSVILAIGWVIIGIIELSTIPLAGSLRLAKGKDKLFSVFGLCGLLFLSSYTVYEFNEIASEYLTRGARQTSVAVEKIRNDIEALSEEKSYLEDAGLDLENEKSKLQTDYEQKYVQENSQYEREKERTVRYYGELLNEAARKAKFPIYNIEETARREHYSKAISEEGEKIAELENHKAQLISDLRDRKMNEIKPRLEALQKEINNIESEISTVEKDKQARIESATGSLFKSKESKIKDIQETARVSRENYQEEIKRLEQERIELQSFDLTSPEISTIEAQIKTSRENIKSYQESLDEIQKFATERMDRPETRAELEKNEEDQNEAYRGRILAMRDLEESHNSKLKKLEDAYNAELHKLEQSSKSKASQLKSRTEIEAEIIEKQNEISEQVEKTARKYERTMYFRMASWFAKGEKSVEFGSLPTREHYNKALWYIFAPIGLFFGVVSIVLAYLGTGFMFEESKRRNPEIDTMATLESKIQDQDKLLQEVTVLEKRLTSAQISEKNLKGRIGNLQAQVEDQDELKKTIDVLKTQLSKNETDLIKQKQRVFDAIKSLPQTIHILDESKKKQTSEQNG